MNEIQLYNILLETIIKEDLELTNLTGSGIFYAPELYIAFVLGKEIKRNEKLIFNQESTWIRETDFGKSGPTDFAFKIKGSTFAFELKIRANLFSYKADIEKLKLLKTGYEGYFIALIDTWETDKENDPRILSLEREYADLKRVSEFISFNTNQTRYKKQICCTLGLWKI